MSSTPLHQQRLPGFDEGWQHSAVEVVSPKLVRVRRPRRVSLFVQQTLFDLRSIFGEADNDIEPVEEKRARDIVGEIIDRGHIIPGVPQSVSAMCGRASGQGTGHARKLLTIAVERALDRFQAHASVVYGAEASAVLTFGMLRKANFEPDAWLADVFAGHEAAVREAYIHDRRNPDESLDDVDIYGDDNGDV